MVWVPVDLLAGLADHMVPSVSSLGDRVVFGLHGPVLHAFVTMSDRTSLGKMHRTHLKASCLRYIPSVPA